MDTDRVLRIALLAGEILMQSGAEIYRAEDTARIISKSYGVNAECFFMPTGIFILGLGEDKKTISLMKRITHRTVDLHRIEMVNAFSRRIIGFILSNKRTKEPIYYPVSGAEEYSAMSSAEGVVQHLGYKATFPLLLNVESQPTYMMALKDAGGLVKMYGMVNVEKYQIVATGETIQSCRQRYRELLKNNSMGVTETETEHISGVIKDIKTASIDGTTFYYIKLASRDYYFVLSVKDNQLVVLKEIGHTITLDAYTKWNKKIRNAVLAE